MEMDHGEGELDSMTETTSSDDDEAPMEPPPGDAPRSGVLILNMHSEYPAVPNGAEHNGFAVMVHVKSPPLVVAEQLDLVAVLDVSESMAGSRLAQVKRAMGFVVDRLGPRDRLSVVAFSDGARQVIRLTRMTEHGKAAAKRAVEALEASGGSTDVRAGLDEAAKALDGGRLRSNVASVILVSGGRQGDTDTGDCNDVLELVPPFLRPDWGSGCRRTPVHTFLLGSESGSGHDAAAAVHRNGYVPTAIQGSRCIIGQDEAVTAVSRAIRRARVGLSDPRRPIASFVFAGPTGVGKSELVKALAAYYYGSEDAMVRLDMSELMEKHAVAKLVGAPPGYAGHGEGGQLTEAVRRRPHSLVLLDEVEKAHPDVMNVLLQVLDDGRLTDGMGRTVDFGNTLIIMTSNIGGGSGDGSSSSKDVVESEMKRYFRPEFLNRLDETIVFRPLTRLQVKEIGAVMVSDVAARVRREMGMELRVTERFTDLLVEEGFDPCYGARALRRAVVRLLEDTLADKWLDGEMKAGDVVTVDADAAGNVAVLGRDSS